MRGFKTSHWPATAARMAHRSLELGEGEGLKQPWTGESDFQRLVVSEMGEKKQRFSPYLAGWMAVDRLGWMVAS